MNEHATEQHLRREARERFFGSLPQKERVRFVLRDSMGLRLFAIRRHGACKI